MDKRVYYRSRWLPWLLLAPQLVVITVLGWASYQAMVVIERSLLK